LASAIRLERTLEPASEKLVLICSDRDLLRAAEREGIQSLNPEEKDSLEKLVDVME